MLPASVNRPRRVLMTLDAVGGVWPYALDAAAMLKREGVDCRLLGFGPPPTVKATDVDLIWTDEPLDWMVAAESALGGAASVITEHVRSWQPDLLHLAAPSQAVGLPAGPPLIVQSHSCVPSWWEAMRDGALPDHWQWQLDRNRQGLGRAEVVIAPSESHGRALARVYGALPNLRIVPNATAPVPGDAGEKQSYVFAAGRWWDEGKNGQVLDQAAARAPWPVLMAGALDGPNGAGLRLSHAIGVGQLQAAETLAHMAQAAIFAAPSRYEPFGLAVLEAASRGAALVIADIETFRELWDGAAVFVDPVDPLAWAAAMTQLAYDAPRRSALGQQAQARAAAFSFERQRAALLSAYEAALAMELV